MPAAFDIADAEPFAVGDSLLHCCDPRTKLAAAVVWAVVLAVLNQPYVLLFGCGFAVAMMLTARLDPGRLGRRLLLVNVFCVFLWLFLPWSTPGEVLTRWGGLTITRPGVLLALLLTLRCNAIVCMCIALLGTSPLTDIAQAMRDFRLPDKLVLIIYFCVRYIQSFGEEYGRLTAAMKLRAFKHRATLHAWRSYANLVGLLFVRGHDRAARIYDAMVCRGFTGRLHSLSRRRLTGRDLALTILLTGATLSLAVIEWRMTN